MTVGGVAQRRGGKDQLWTGVPKDDDPRSAQHGQNSLVSFAAEPELNQRDRSSAQGCHRFRRSARVVLPVLVQ